jgi:hypothetical protein
MASDLRVNFATTLEAKIMTFSRELNINHLSTEDKARLLMRNSQRNIKARQEAMLGRAAAEIGVN